MSKASASVVEKPSPKASESVVIKPPRMRSARFKISGTAPLVIHRFSQKTQIEFVQKMEEGKSASSKKKREAVDTDAIYNQARYISPEGWDGFNAASIRCAMVNVCRLVDFKMTLAKMSIFTIADGWDAIEKQIPLVRIIGKPEKQQDICRTSNGQPYVCFRPRYFPWKANLHIEWDADQFSAGDVTSLLARVGIQCGIGEGRPFSKNSTGMGWGTFKLEEMVAE